ncbi:hypothetical protein QBC42DRAFT_332557 [Cladorrhinum samala]|uniref:C2H2-type domain-containing protein n=1 Tax=Cladorrhinum samala TaxID=585594 RepID=A0AAV9HK09_9PEZI|nr:hypothetical protein QBC42DRAFT_332557 [Cladorrhinum samala]
MDPATGSELLPRLACPFYKFNPETYRACGEKKLRHASDIRVHFNRCHRQPVFCPRCKRSFKGRAANAHLHEHLRQRPQCPLKHQRDPAGLSEDNLKLIRKKTEVSPFPDLTQTERQWYGMWRVCFPRSPFPRSVYHGIPEDRQPREDRSGERASPAARQEFRGQTNGHPARYPAYSEMMPGITPHGGPADWSVPRGAVGSQGLQEFLQQQQQLELQVAALNIETAAGFQVVTQNPVDHVIDWQGQQLEPDQGFQAAAERDHAGSGILTYPGFGNAYYQIYQSDHSLSSDYYQDYFPQEQQQQHQHQQHQQHQQHGATFSLPETFSSSLY